METRKYQVCTNCVMDTSDSKIVFDEKGVCDHCHNFYENIKPNWNPQGNAEELNRLIENIKRDGQGKKYDCLIGLSGGVDSSYVAYSAVKKWGLRPLIFAVDTCWNLDVANKNIQKIIDKLGVDVHYVKIDHDEMMDLQLAFFKSQVPYQDTPQDHMIFASLYNFAAENGFKYILTGGNYSTECVREPNEWVHENDIRLIKDIHKRFGTRQLKHMKFCGMFKYRLYYRYFKGIRVCKVLDLVPYFKKEAIEELQNEFGWEPYANKHFESIFTRFYEGYWLPKKFGYDKRRAHFSSLILTGQLSRDEALEILKSPPYSEDTAMEDMAFICNEMGISVDEFKELMAGENKTYKDYKNGYSLIHTAREIAKVFGVERRNIR
ncbi:N-acetyl sugar amidotransferase [Gehongia tenuis]|uniref:N-acetyl sugar amidotransferase n=1 Tax=Gehongia tenuis TaxID=2763655 RepID=A0A926D6M4_9FIRM|nr:N-acetyl sugar amidotransferase [Gehongia tenuis]MBC8532363.1 N-acetyl sugar amidotransferase [Gehongia tenuis]